MTDGVTGLASMEELSRRLRAARERAGLTQEQAATALGLPRTAIVKLESGARDLSSMELVKLARLYGREVGELLASESEEPPIEVLFRANPKLAQPEVSPHIIRCISVCRELASLERMVGNRAAGPLKAAYDLPAPASKWQAIQQGQQVAADERRRLGLGDAPVWEIVDVIRSQGIRAAEYPLPESISGLSFTGPDAEPIIIVNSEHVLERRLYSFAHEYAHRLMDRRLASVTPTKQNEKPPMETRADVFAAHLLLPPEGVRRFIETLGKHEGAELQLPGVVSLANYFVVSHETAVYQLKNLGIITATQMESFLGADNLAKRYREALTPKLPRDTHWDLFDEMLDVGLEAHAKGEITRRKVEQLIEDAGPHISEERKKNVQALLEAR